MAVDVGTPAERSGRKSDFLYRGNSMRMVFRDGDGILVDKCRYEELRPGDVVCFILGERRTVHRLIDREGRTCGDNNDRIDPGSLTADKLVGRVSAFRRGRRTFHVHGGSRGMLEFRLHRARRRTVRAAAKLFSPLRGVTGFLAEASGRPRLESYPGRKLLYWHGILLASCLEDGKITPRSRWTWLFRPEKIGKYFEDQGNS